MNYIPLHILTGYSFLSSSLKVEDIFKVCSENKYVGFGVCDYNVMHAYPEMDNGKSKYNISPIYGASFNVIYDDITLCLVCYIKNEKGYQNLIKIISHYPNGIETNELKKYGEGLIAILPTISNTSLDAILSTEDISSLSKMLSKFNSCFDEFFLGVEQYSKDDASKVTFIREFVTHFPYPLVAFNKILYINKTDAISLNILQAIKNDQKLSDKEASGPYFVLKDIALEKIYTKDEIDATNNIFNKCKDFVLFIKRGKLLNFPLEGNKKEYIYSKCVDALKSLNKYNDKYISRLTYELDTIESMGYLDYFLIVQDYVLFAKNNDIAVGPGRGSAAGSLVSYLLNITEVDPLEFDLLFERFLNPKRTSMPDIDMDFEDNKRELVSNYIRSKYGYLRTSYIVTFQTFGPRAALRDIGRIFNFNNSDISMLSADIGKFSSFADAYRNSPAFREKCKDDYFLSIVRLAKRIEGLPRQQGMHAAGVIINEDDLANSIPMIYKEQLSIAQFDAPALERLGFLKMDILGLTNLTIIKDMVRYINQYYDKSFNINKIDYQEKKTFEILNLGFTVGLFQLESAGITNALKQVHIDSFNDIVAVLALYRPGPMENIPLYAKNKNENVKVEYIVPALEKILSPTYGVIVYQEQIMQIVQEIANFDLGQADLFRRAISKKDSEKLQSLKSDFINGAINNNYTEEKANAIFDLIYKFANYGFNKSHSVSYAMITYQMAYIKANYPLAFYAGILNTLSLADQRVSAFQKEFKYFNIELRLPMINKSKLDFVIDNNSLIIPFRMIKGLNQSSLDAINHICKKKISSFDEFVQKSLEYKIPDSAIIALINAGVFDEFKQNRQTLRSAYSQLRQFYELFGSEGDITKDSLNEFYPNIIVQEEDKKLSYQLEYQALGVLLSGSFLENYQKSMQENNIVTISNGIKKFFGKNINIAGMICDVREVFNKRKETMAFIKLQDNTQDCDIVVFPSLLKEFGYLINEHDIVMFTGRFTKRNEEISFIASSVSKLEEDI